AGLPAGAAPPGAPAQAGRGGGAGATITSITSSNVAPGVIWVGMSNGAVQVTRNHGLAWTEAALPEPTVAAGAGGGVGGGRGGGVTATGAAYPAAGAAYIAINRGTAVNTPAFYRTHDYGKTWTKIINGLPTGQVSGSYSRVIRADTKRAGLL